MKKVVLPGFIALFGILSAFMYTVPMAKHEGLPRYSPKARLAQDRRADGRGEERAQMLINFKTGQVERDDWYKALADINSRSKGLHTRANDLEWEDNGPDYVGGRTRSFVFDKTDDNGTRCYAGGVSGGIFVSDDLGFNWKPVDNMDEQMPILSIGCMAQSKDGDIYAGTGEYWGNPVGNADFNSQHYGNGIYKKKADEDNWEHLSSTVYNPTTTANNNGDFNYVIDIACDENDNDIVYAATTVGLFKSTDGGSTWDKTSLTNGVVAQIKQAPGGNILYAGANGKVYKSTDAGTTWEDLIKTQSQYVAESQGGRQHMRIAVSHTNEDKLYACGITNGGNLKYVILSEDGGDSWEYLGKGDNYLNALCNLQGNTTQCQGWYDLCLKTNPGNDDVIYLGGAPNIFSWTRGTGWVQLTNGYTPDLGTNQVHADHHEFVFHPTRPDTMVVCTDGGVYMTYNGLSGLPNNVVWRPRNYNYNVTQFYDIDANIYGEVIGGTQDNGTPLTTLKGNARHLTFEVKGGDGFDVGISAKNDYRVAFATTYYGDIKRTSDLSSNMKDITSGTCGSAINTPQSGKEFHTKIDLVESIVYDEFTEMDSVEASYLFAVVLDALYISPNAYNPDEGTAWYVAGRMGVGGIRNVRGAKDASTIYIAGTGGVRRIKDFRDVVFENNETADPPCLKASGIQYESCTGIGANVANVFVDWNDPNHAVAVKFGFGGNHVFETQSDGVTFVSKQGDLPDMPVYDCVIDPEDSKHVIVATEFGLWETKDISASSPVWEEQNKNIGRVPVFKLVLNKFHNDGCNVLYAGTHGRGSWRVPFNDAGGCDFKIVARPEESNSINSIVGSSVAFNIYPNPASDIVKVAFISKTPKTYYLNIFDMGGRKVKSITYKSYMGDNIVSTNVRGLLRGNYIVRLEDEESVIGGKNLVLE